MCSNSIQLLLIWCQTFRAAWWRWSFKLLKTDKDDGWQVEREQIGLMDFSLEVVVIKLRDVIAMLCSSKNV